MTPDQTKVLADRFETLGRIVETIQSTTADPAQSLIAQGRAMIYIGEQLQGMSPEQAVAVLRSAESLLRVSPTPQPTTEGE